MASYLELFIESTQSLPTDLYKALNLMRELGHGFAGRGGALGKQHELARENTWLFVYLHIASKMEKLFAIAVIFTDRSIKSFTKLRFLLVIFCIFYYFQYYFIIFALLPHFTFENF